MDTNRAFGRSDSLADRLSGALSPNPVERAETPRSLEGSLSVALANYVGGNKVSAGERAIYGSPVAAENFQQSAFDLGISSTMYPGLPSRSFRSSFPPPAASTAVEFVAPRQTRTREEARRCAIAAGALEPATMGERIAHNWDTNHEGSGWSSSPVAQERLERETTRYMYAPLPVEPPDQPVEDPMREHDVIKAVAAICGFLGFMFFGYYLPESIMSVLFMGYLIASLFTIGPITRVAKALL